MKLLIPVSINPFLGREVRWRDGKTRPNPIASSRSPDPALLHPATTLAVLDCADHARDALPEPNSTT